MDLFSTVCVFSTVRGSGWSTLNTPHLESWPFATANGAEYANGNERLNDPPFALVLHVERGLFRSCSTEVALDDSKCKIDSRS